MYSCGAEQGLRATEMRHKEWGNRSTNQSLQPASPSLPPCTLARPNMGRQTPRCKRGYQSRTCRQVRARAGTALLLTLRLVLLPLALLVPMVGEVKVRDGEPQQHVPRHTVGHAVGIEGTKGVQVDPVASDTLALQAGQVAQVRLHGVHGRGADAGVDRDALRYEVLLERHPPACLPAPESAMGDEARQLSGGCSLLPAATAPSQQHW